MSIGSGDTIHKFGTQVSVLQNTGGNLVNGAFSTPGDATRWTNADDVPKANMVLNITFTGTPSGTANVTLYGAPQDIQSTFDANDPSASFPHQYLGVFPIDSSGTNTWTSIEIDLPNPQSGQPWDFFIRNNAGVDASAYQVYLRPLTVGAKA